MSEAEQRKARLIVFISGSGTNLQAIIDAIADDQLLAEIVLVVANRQKAYGLVRAEQAGIATLTFPLKSYLRQGHTREAYDAELAARIRPYRPDLVVLVGWMHVFSHAFLDHYPKQVINLHPALPGTFPGTNAIERAFAAYQQGTITESGCMVHYAIPEVDAGPVVAQVPVPITPDDTLETFEARMHSSEHLLIVQSIKRIIG